MALSANRNLVDQQGVELAHPVAVAHVFKGALVKHNAAGYLAPCSGEAGSAFAGVAIEEVDNSAGAAGALVCKTAKEGCFELPGTGFSQTDVGQAAYAADDSSVQTAAGTTSLQKIGTIEKFISSTKVLVKIQIGLGLGAAS